MSIILDLIVLAIIVLAIIISACKGFVRTLIEIVGFIAVLILATTASKPLANFTYDKFIEPNVVSAVSDSVASTGAGMTSKVSTVQIDNAVEKMPEAVKNLIGTETVEKFTSTLNENVQSGAQTAAEQASQNVIKPLVANILSLLYAFVIFTILIFVVMILAKVLNKAVSFSIMDKINRILGGCVGAAKGIIVSILFCSVIAAVIALLPNGFWFFTAENIEATVLFKVFAKILFK